MYKKLIVLCFLLRPLIGAGQTAGIDSIPSAFERYRASHIQEKVYAHIDRTSYLAGELVWFKLYHVDAVFNRPLDLSSVAYVEVLDAQSKAVVQAKVAVQKGKGAGSIYLPVSMASGSYRLRAYTRWMKNFSPDFFFEENIRVINTLKEHAEAAKVQAKSYDFQFFPEGGDLVAGISSKVAFRAINQSGKGVNFSGVIYDQAGNVITELNPAKFGIGSFLFTPAQNETYKAVIEFSDGTRTSYKLPEARENAYRLAVTENGEQVVVDIASGNRNEGLVYLFAHASNKIEFASRVSLENGRAQIAIPKSKLFNGITHFTLFNQEYKPVSERLWFKRNRNLLQLIAKTGHQEYGLRNKVVLDIQSMLADSGPVSADVSVSVFNADSLQQGTHAGINSYLSLASELRGTIEQPDFYFSDDTEAIVALDNLMLTHGWRRFNWNDVLSRTPSRPQYVPETSHHIVQARLLSSGTNRPAAGVKSYLSVPGKGVLFFSAVSQANGRVDFYTKGLSGIQSLVLQTDKTDTALFSIDLISPFSSKYSGRTLPATSLVSLPGTTLLVNSINMQALNIYLKERLNHFRKVVPDSIPFYGVAKEKYLLDDYTRFPTVEEVLREYVLSVGVRRRNGKPVMMVYTGEPNKGFFEEQPLVLMDGVPMFDREKFFSFEPLKVKSVEVLPKRYFYGQDVYGGLIRFNTYKANLDGMELDPNASIIDYDGLQQVREFYSPRYDSQEQLNSRLPDFRNLLFWKPDVETGADGKAQLSFYTSDRPGTYRAVVQGLTTQGYSGRYSFDFIVK